MSTLNSTLSDLFDGANLNAIKENDPHGFLAGKSFDQLDADAKKIFDHLGITSQAIEKYRDANGNPFSGTNIEEKRISAFRLLVYNVSTDLTPKAIENMKQRTLEALCEVANHLTLMNSSVRTS